MNGDEVDDDGDDGIGGGNTKEEEEEEEEDDDDDIIVVDVVFISFPSLSSSLIIVDPSLFFSDSSLPISSHYNPQTESSPSRISE